MLMEEAERIGRELGRVEPIEVCVARAGDWAVRGAPSAVIADIRRLASMGVTWLSFHLDGQFGRHGSVATPVSATQLVKRIERFDRDVLAPLGEILT